MILRREGQGWHARQEETYKDEPGGWAHVRRTVLFDSDRSRFQARYFAIAPGGCTDLEQHGHEHFVLVLDGVGEVTLGGKTSRLGPGDAVHVGPDVPHQFSNPGTEVFGILCVVDRERDRPRIVEPGGAAARLTRAP